jgi:hypothetical protein
MIPGEENNKVSIIVIRRISKRLLGALSRQSYVSCATMFGDNGSVGRSVSMSGKLP